MKQENQELPKAKLVRLTNGDDIICELVELGIDEDIEQYVIINPLRVMYMGSQNPGYMQLGFLPYVFPRICDKQEFVINIKDVLFVTDINAKMNEHYYESIDSLYDEEPSQSDIRKAVANQFSDEEFEEDDPTIPKTFH